MNKKGKIAAYVIGGLYLLVLAYFGFKPFQRIPGLLYTHPESAMEGHMGPGTALEDRLGSFALRNNLVKTGRMSLEILLKTDSLSQEGPARIISFSRDSMSRDFTLGQSGKDLSFRLHTTETDRNGTLRNLRVPNVFDHKRWQHLIVTYDGETVCLYVDGQLHPSSIELTGSFNNWGRNHLLTMGDEVSGGRPWTGRIRRFSIYDRGLNAAEVASLYTGTSIPGAVYFFPRIQKDGQGMCRIKYRNLFIYSDSVFNLHDCIFNTIGFMPLAMLLWLVLPAALRRYRFATGVLLPLILGLAISGTIEFVQRSILGRVPCLEDLVYNFVGTLLGGLLLWGMIIISKKGETT